MMNISLDSWIAPAYAEAAGTVAAPAGGSPFSLIVMGAVFFLFFYFLMWRPQNKRAKEHRELLNSLVKGDEIITSGGVLGKINKISEQYVGLSVHEGVDMVIQKAAIVSVLPKGTLKSLE